MGSRVQVIYQARPLVSRLVAVGKIWVKEVWVEQRQNDGLLFVELSSLPTGIENTDAIMLSKRYPLAMLAA